MKRVYARFVGRAHPSIRGYHVEHALRKLADDQRNPSNVAGIAQKALAEGPHVLPILADALEETKHPMANAYNWRAIPRGIAIDQAALAADRELGSPYPNLEHQPGNNISLAWMVDDGNQGIGEAARVRGHNALRRIRGRIADSVPDATPEEVSESIRRLALTRQDLTNSEAYPMLARQHHAKHNAAYPAAPGVSRHDDARRFRGTQVLLRRRPLKVRYAQFVGRAHPSIRGYHVEHALRSLADPDRNHPDIAGLARHALENGPGNLPILADALEEHEHPMLGRYNWKAIPRGIQVDQAVRGAARSIAARRRDGRTSAASVMHSASLQLPENVRPPEFTNLFGPDPYPPGGLNDLHATARGVVPDLSAREFFDSLRRLRDVRSRTAPGLGRSIAGSLHVNRAAAANATGPVSPGSGPVGEAHRFGSSPVSLGNTRLGPPLARRVPPRRMSRKVRYASFPGADTPTVTVRVPVPTPAPMTKKKPQQPVLQKFGNTVAPAPPPQPAAPGMVPQQPQDQDFAPVPFAGPRTIIFPHSPPPKGKPVQPRRMARIQYPGWHDVWKQRGLGFAAKLLWRIAAEEGQYPESGEIATVALATGHTGALPMLDRTLAEEGNPLAGVVHWKNVPKAVELHGLVNHWLLNNNRLHNSAQRMFGVGAIIDNERRAQAALRLDPRYSGLGKFVAEAAKSGHTRGEVIHALSRTRSHDSGVLGWGELHETEPGQPFTFRGMDYLPGGYQEIKDRNLIDLVNDPRSRYHLYPFQRFADPPEPEQPQPSPRGRRRMSRRPVRYAAPNEVLGPPSGRQIPDEEVHPLIRGSHLHSQLAAGVRVSRQNSPFHSMSIEALHGNIPALFGIIDEMFENGWIGELTAARYYHMGEAVRNGEHASVAEARLRDTNRYMTYRSVPPIHGGKWNRLIVQAEENPDLRPGKITSYTYKPRKPPQRKPRPQ